MNSDVLFNMIKFINEDKTVPSIGSTLFFIMWAHNGQLDKGGNEYWLHPLRVMYKVYMLGGSSDAMISALLHDVLEDTSVTKEELEKLYSADIINTVDLLTRKDDGLTYMQWIQSIADSGNMDAILVKYADNLDNSDPARIMQLPESERSIVKRYEKSKNILRKQLT